MRSQNRLRLLSAVVLFAGLALAVTVVSKSPTEAEDEGESQIQRGFAISPVSLNLQESRFSGIGSYYENSTWR